MEKLTFRKFDPVKYARRNITLDQEEIAAQLCKNPETINSRQLQKAIKSYLKEIHDQLHELSSENEKIKMLACKKLDLTTERTFAQFCSDKKKLPGFTRNMVKLIDNQIDYHKTLASIPASNGTPAKQKSDKPTETSTLKWLSDKRSISHLHDTLVFHKMIEPLNGDKLSFINFFSGSAIKHSAFIWNENLNLLAYLFECLIDLGVVAKKGANYNSLIRDTKFFVDHKHNTISNLKGLKDVYLNSKTGLPRNHAVIDSVLSAIHQR